MVPLKSEKSIFTSMEMNFTMKLFHIFLIQKLRQLTISLQMKTCPVLTFQTGLIQA